MLQKLIILSLFMAPALVLSSQKTINVPKPFSQQHYDAVNQLKQELQGIAAQIHSLKEDASRLEQQISKFRVSSNDPLYVDYKNKVTKHNDLIGEYNVLLKKYENAIAAPIMQAVGMSIFAGTSISPDKK